MPLGRRRRVRRRRAAMVAGGAYAVHKHHQHQEQEQEEQEQGQRQADEAAAVAPAEQAPVQAAPGISSDDAAQLTELKGLLDSGVLTQDEFDAEKQKILRG